ncbi:MAG TPA: Gfo/Idh/MocA family oxidoreductase [Pyrinomonadaceae bacterium]|nr:Gfo/Idh/MocA family oxidoreductase [Pyrinomonadaceae bacterium]
MNLTEEQKTIGRRNFLKAVAGVPALVALGGTVLTRGPVRGGPVRIALVGTGDMGKGHLNQYQKEFCDLKALCDINPKRRKAMVDMMVQKGWPAPKEYDDWQEMLQKEDLEAVHLATPLWTHSTIAVGALNAGKHVLCEKMMAKSALECQQMIDAAKKNNRVLEIGYQRYYNPIYQAAYTNIIKQGVLGDVYHARLAWHRNNSWRRKEEGPANVDFNKYGYPDWEHLLNWRMYRKYSEGLLCELGSHQVTAASWFFDSHPTSVYVSSGTYEYKDGREVADHVFATFNYPGDRTATFSSIQSNAFEENYEMFMGTKGTLIMTRELEAYLFNEGDGGNTRVEVSRQSAGPVADSSASQPAGSTSRTVNLGDSIVNKGISYQNEIAEFCSAIRTGTAVRCGGEKAMTSAVAILTGNLSAERGTKLEIPGPQST